MVPAYATGPGGRGAGPYQTSRKQHSPGSSRVISFETLLYYSPPSRGNAGGANGNHATRI